MKTPMFTLAIAALALATTAAAEKPAKPGKCPSFAIKSRTGPAASNWVMFSVDPTRDDTPSYNWLIESGGTISSGQGTSTIMVDTSGAGASGKMVTATVQLGGVERSCPETSRTKSASAPIPP